MQVAGSKAAIFLVVITEVRLEIDRIFIEMAFVVGVWRDRLGAMMVCRVQRIGSEALTFLIGNCV